MNKLFLLIAIASVVLLIGCTTPNVTSDVKDCGTDLKCFQDAAVTCQKAKVVYTNTSSEGISVSANYEIQGGTVDACTFYMMLTDMVYPTAGMTDEQKAQIELLTAMFKGKDLKCTLPASQFSTQNPMSQQDFSESCSGTLIDIIKSFQGMQNPTQ